MVYADVTDVQARMSRQLDETEQQICETLLEDAGAMIDATGTTASYDIRKIVSCRIVMRAIGNDAEPGIPIGSTQGSMSALGYQQSWTMGSGGGAGELYLSKTEKKMLGVSNRIGSYSPVEGLIRTSVKEES